MSAYRQGAFPMSDPAEPLSELGWYLPDPRAVIVLDAGDDDELRSLPGLHVPRRLSQRMRSRPFALTSDRAFGEVVRVCARPRRDGPSSSSETWIDGRVIEIFDRLHAAGVAHSVEAWSERGELVGGVYGLAVGRVFCAESMFTRPELGGTDAGKVALITLAMHLRSRGFTLIDTQFTNPHVSRFGAVEIPSEVYLSHLARVCHDEINWGSLSSGEGVPHSGQGSS